MTEVQAQQAVAYEFPMAATQTYLMRDRGEISRADETVHQNLLWCLNEAELNARGKFTDTSHGSND